MSTEQADESVIALIRRQAVDHEPTYALRCERVVARGRRRLRERRISLALRLTVAVAVVACLAGAPVPAEGLTPASATGSAVSASSTTRS